MLVILHLSQDSWSILSCEMFTASLHISWGVGRGVSVHFYDIDNITHLPWTFPQITEPRFPPSFLDIFLQVFYRIRLPHSPFSTPGATLSSMVPTLRSLGASATATLGLLLLTAPFPFCSSSHWGGSGFPVPIHGEFHYWAVNTTTVDPQFLRI